MDIGTVIWFVLARDDPLRLTATLAVVLPPRAAGRLLKRNSARDPVADKKR
jgi:hypothetical protein